MDNMTSIGHSEKHQGNLMQVETHLVGNMIHHRVIEVYDTDNISDSVETGINATTRPVCKGDKRGVPFH